VGRAGRLSATWRAARRMSGCAKLATMLLLAAACTPTDNARTNEAPRPNIVLIYADDLGWRDLGVQGSTYYETPNIDRLASQGMRFTNAYSNAPNCAPSRAALMSGQYAPRTGVYTVASAARGRAENRRLVPVQNRTDLDLGVVTVAEALRSVGYVTGEVGKWHLGGEGSLPTDQGFDWSVAGDAAGSPPSYFYPYERNGRSIPGLEDGEEGEYLADRLTEEAIGFIETNRAEPFFLYLPHYSVHTPIQGPPALIEKYEGKPASQGHGDAEYAAMVEAMDSSVGQLLDALDRLGLADNTLVVFYADNGGYGPRTSMEPLRGSKGMLYEGGIREPLIVRWPGRVEAGTTSDEPVIGTDFYPTLLSLSGAEAPAGQLLDGRSLLPALEGDASPERDIFWHFPAYLGAYAGMTGAWRTTPASVIRRGNHKLIHFFEDDVWELYDLEADIGESHDLSEEMPERTAELREALEAWWVETDAFIPAPVLPDSALGLPLIDLNMDEGRHVVVDRVPGQYLGHPTTQLMDDGQTILTVYPEGHGRGPIVYKRSRDGGQTWSDRIPVPESWATSLEVPTLFRVQGPEGTDRLVIFSGLYPIRRAISDDGGETWSELEPIGDFGGIVAMSSLHTQKSGDLLAFFHDDGRFLRNGGERTTFQVFATRSSDAGLTWSEPWVVTEHTDADLCEPGLVVSPDGERIALLLRENSRQHESFVVFSDDDGETWSEPRGLPPSLTGDRHTARYAADGRLVVTFRDMAGDSPTKGDWVVWTGDWNDIVTGRPGQYRVRVKDNRNAWDAAYAGLELLPDGTFVTTTYGHWDFGQEPYILSSRFTLDELDERVAGRE
jgi:arylsulfatase A-like enzyme